MIAALIIACAAMCPVTLADESAFRQAMRELGTDLRLMCVAAHPDDEDGATLAKYRKKYGLQTFAIIATRGEGGQNETGPELYEALGVIRTREMMAAAEITGADLHFLNLPEFGYSKSLEETFRIWRRDETVRRLVRVIRLTRPDVIISNHGLYQDHGHHQAIGAALRDAFSAAADPARYPEQLARGLEPWQAARLYMRVWEPTATSIEVDINEVDSALGVSYAQIAADALKEHRSQGMQGFIDRYERGEMEAHYELIREAQQPGEDNGAAYAPAPDANLLRELMDRVPHEDRELAQSSLDRETLKAILFERLSGRDADAERGFSLPDKWDRAAALAAEFELEAQVPAPIVAPGEPAQITAALHDHGRADTTRVRFALLRAPWFPVADTTTEIVETGEAQTARVQFEVTPAADTEYTWPPEQYLFAPAFMRPQFDVLARAEAGNAVVRLSAPVRLDIAPPVELHFDEVHYLVRPESAPAVSGRLVLTNHSQGRSAVEVALTAPEGFSVSPARAELVLDNKGARDEIAFTLRAGSSVAEGSYPLSARIVETEDAAEATVRAVRVAVPEARRVGVVQSYDDTFMKTLARLGVPHKALEAEELTADGLAQYTTVIVDIRAYLVRPDLAERNDALLGFVRGGGTVLVMYHKTMEWDPEYAPYPIHLSSNRVTQAGAPVEVLEPAHPLFNTPNVIGPDAWQGWRQERGLYFPGRWDARYTPLVATADPGEDIPPGSLLAAAYGDGVYLYTALGWYRQLRELHPGSLKVFANMLAL